MGCKKSEEGGRSGNDTFRVSVPAMPTTIKQGETQVVRVGVDRGTGFKQSVKLVITAPKGLDVDPESTTVNLGDKGDVQVTIKAAKDAPLGDQKIAVKGTPGNGGEPTSTEFAVKVVAP
jgi:uncharacterized membrane protein